MCAPGDVLKDVHYQRAQGRQTFSPSVYSRPALDVVMSDGVRQPQGPFCAVDFFPLVIPGKQTLPSLTSF